MRTTTSTLTAALLCAGSAVALSLAVPGVASASSCDPTTVDQGSFDPGSQRYLNKAAWADPGPLQFGNAPRQDAHVRGFRNAVEDVSLFKETMFGERFKWRLEIQGGNITNRVVFADPNVNWSSGAFGQVALQANQPRSIQLGTRIEF